MYKNRKIGKKVPPKGVGTAQKRGLNTIDEDTTIKLPRVASVSKTNVSDDTEMDDDTFGGSEENIPASQEQTQRYLSQRSVLAATTLGRTQSRLNCSRPPNTYFELVLMKSGVQLDEGDTFVLTCDHVAFVSRFREVFLRAPNYPENVETFKSGLANALAPKSKLAHKLLTGCIINAPGEEHTYQSQNSMFVNFLMIDFLRDVSLEVLLDKIESAAGDAHAIFSSGNVPLLSLMLSQLRYVTLTHSEQIYARIKRIFEQANEAAKTDIIACAEYVLDAFKHDDFAELLIENYAQSKDLFQNATIQTLTNLSLSLRLQERLRARILSYIKDAQCPDASLPQLVRFMLKILNEDTDDSVRELVSTLREIFNYFAYSNTAKTFSKQTQLELFNYLEQGLTRSKRFYNNWQKTIAGLPGSQFRCFDFIILLLLIHIKEDNSLYIENILRRRIKLEHITVDILADMKLHYVHVLEQHINTLMQILHDFMREKNRPVADFAKSAYSILFKLCDAIQRQILKKLLELTCEKSAPGMINMALQLLRELQRNYPSDVQNYGMLLMPLLDRLHEMSLSQTRLTMELLCSIAFPAPTLGDCPALQDQIDMLVKKQLINRNVSVKKQGIISSAQLIDSIARTEELQPGSQDDFNTTYNTISDLPDGRGKVAANCVLRTQSATVHCAESLALFYDELASVCIALPQERANNGLQWDRPFVIWLCELMTYFFQNSFVAEHHPGMINGISLAYLKCINSLEDTTTNSEAEVLNIGINISELVLKPTTDANSSIIVLAPLFNLLRVLQLQRYGGSLETINALLGCAIILPEFFDEATPDVIYYDYDTTQQKQILDIYFYTVNWMRVTICAFATQREASTREKVLQRLAELIEIERRIKLLLMRMPPDYVPPQSQFLKSSATHGVVSAAAKTQRGRPMSAAATGKSKRDKSKNIQNETEQLALNDTEACSGAANQTRAGDLTIKLANSKACKPVKLDFEQLYGPLETYRQLDTDIMLLLHEQLNIEYPLAAHDIGKSFGLLEFRFILTDLVHKLESVIGVEKSEHDYTLQYIAKPHYFIADLSKFLNIIGKNMQAISSAIVVQLDQVNYVYSNADLFTDHCNYLKACFGLCIRLLATYFAWNEFTDKSHEDLLKASFLALLPTARHKLLHKKSNAHIAVVVFEQFIKYEKSIVNLGTAVQLQQLLRTLRKYTCADEQELSMAEQQAQDIRKLCRTLLCRKWYHYDGTSEKGGQCNIYLDELVKGFLKDSQFTRQKEILRVLLEECKNLQGKETTLKTFPNFKKANFPLLFRGLCEILIATLSDKVTSHASGASAVNEQLLLWEQSIYLLNILLEIMQNVEQPRNFLLFSKHSNLYLKLLLQHGLPVLETSLRHNTERITSFLKQLQVVTRYLHNLCCQSKAQKQLSIINQIPFLRETVENLVFRVKALLAANKCHSVFWMGNLINKDLCGETIVTPAASMLSSDANGADDDSDEEMPEDDVSLVETILGRNVSIATAEDSAASRRSANCSKSSSRSKCF